MAKIGLIFTTDYEVFGNGSGSVEKCMLAPTKLMTEPMEKVGAPLTVFFDVCEYWAFEREFKAGKLSQDYADQIKRQLQELLSKGHDVQLHFHPQWLGATYQQEKWLLNYDQWRIGAMPEFNAEVPEWSLPKLFAEGKATLEKILKPVKPNYECNTFRAGAWSIQPEAKVLKAMLSNGFKVDSTVAAEMHFEDDFTYYDFRGTPKKPFWRINQELLTPTANGLLEIPIFTVDLSFAKRLRFLMLKKLRGTAMKPTGCHGTAIAATGKSTPQKIMSALAPGRSMFNFSDATTFEEMRYFAERAIEQYAPLKMDSVPIVAISHPKTFANLSEWCRFLAWAKGHRSLQFNTYQDFINL